MSRGSPESSPALEGLRAAISRYPGLTVTAIADWVRVPRGTVQRWLAGKAPNVHYIEQLHDFIESRIRARPTPEGWAFEPVAIAEREAARERGKMHRLHAAIGDLAAGKASLHVSDGVVAILRDGGEFSSEEDLTERLYANEDAGMETQQATTDGGQRKLHAFYWSQRDREVAHEAASRMGITVSEFIRRAIHSGTQARQK